MFLPWCIRILVFVLGCYGGCVVCFSQVVKVFFYHFFFGVGDFEEAFVQRVYIVTVERISNFLETEGQGAASAAGGEHNAGFVCADFFGVNDLVGGSVFQEAVLVNTGGMGESVGADDGFIGLNGHPHRIGYEAAEGVQLFGVDIGIKSELFVLFDDHDYFFERSIAGSFSESIDRAFDLAGSVADAGDGVGCGKAEVIVAMTGDNGFVDIGDMVYEEGDLLTVLFGQAVAGGIGNIDDGGAGGDNGFDDAGEIIVVGAACVFCVEFHVIYEVLCPFHGLDGTFENLFAVGVELISDMRVRSADAGMDAGAPGGFEGLCGHFDIFLHGAAKAADDGIFDCLCDFFHGMEVTGAGDRETGFDDIDAKGFELEGQFDLFPGVELAAGYLFPVAEGGIKDEDFLVGHSYILKRIKIIAYGVVFENTFV
jgi:hypothetical protein